MAFEVFDREVHTPAEGARVYIGNVGRLTLSSEAKRLLDLIRPATKMVELLYDRDTRRVAIRPVASSTSAVSRRFPVQVLRSPHWPAGILADEFVSRWKLPRSLDQKFAVQVGEVEGSQVLLFDLRAISPQDALD